MAETASRGALENALVLYAPQNRQAVAKIFLEALSVDELLFLAEFLGSSILIGSTMRLDTWDAIRRRANWLQREDVDHKLILVSEFAVCCGFPLHFR